MKTYACIIISIILVLFFYEDAFCKGGSSSSSSSSSRSSSSSSSRSSSSGNKSTTGGKVVSAPGTPKVVGHGVANTPSAKPSHPMAAGAIGSKEYGQSGFKTTTPPPKAEAKNFVKYTPQASANNPSPQPVYYQPYPQQVYSNGGSGMPSWFWIWWMTSGNNRSSYHHDVEKGEVVKEVKDVSTGQVIERTPVDPSLFEEENTWAEVSFTIFALVVLGLFLGLIYWLVSKFYYGRKKGKQYAY